MGNAALREKYQSQKRINVAEGVILHSLARFFASNGLLDTITYNDTLNYLQCEITGKQLQTALQEFSQAQNIPLEIIDTYFPRYVFQLPVPEQDDINLRQQKEVKVYRYIDVMGEKNPLFDLLIEAANTRFASIGKPPFVVPPPSKDLQEARRDIREMRAASLTSRR